MERRLMNKLLRIRQVVERTGLSRSLVYSEMKRGAFPRNLKIGPRAAAWPEAEVDAWVRDRLAAREG
jgi:prophage regulatory protein